MKDLFLDAEWFIGGEIFLLGWCFDKKNHGQLYDDSLTAQNFEELLNQTTGIIYFYGPDIGIIEKYFDIDIRSNYHCVNLLKVFKDKIPNLKNYKLATIEKMYGLQRNRNEYKANIFRIFEDWRKPQLKSLVLQYNREDVINLCILKHIVFWSHDIDENYLLQVRLAGVTEIVRNYVYLLPCDVYRGTTFGKFSDPDEVETNRNITAQLVVRSKFYDDKVALYRMIVLMHDVVKEMQFDLITPVNNRDSKFHLAKALATGIGKRSHTPAMELLQDGNSKCSNLVRGKKVLIVDDVIYKGTTMAKAIEAVSKQKPEQIYFLAFGKSQRFAY